MVMPNVEKTRALDKPIWLSVDDACYAASIGKTRLYELIDLGAIESRKLGKRRLISFASIEALGAEAA
jgi:excisionase family DNA binding protein